MRVVRCRARSETPFYCRRPHTATADVECRKDADVIDETPMAYKPISAVMDAHKGLVDIVHTLHQVVCVKG